MKQDDLYTEFKKWFAHKTILAKTSKFYLDTKRKICFYTLQTTFRDFETMNKYEFSKR